MNRISNNRAAYFIGLLVLFLCNYSTFHAQDIPAEFEISPRVVFIRAFADADEKKPPILLLPDKSGIASSIGSQSITIQLDVAASIPPALVAKFVHCSADWKETENIFLNDIIYSRTTMFEWDPAPMSQHYYDYRATLTIPNQQVRFKFSGNWKVKIYEMTKNELLAETRIFVVQPRAEAYIGMNIDFYKSQFKVSNTGVDIEAVVKTSSNIIDGNASMAVLYKNHRWFEPYFISDRFENDLNDRYRYHFPTWVKGIIYNGKSFRINGLPAENAYRILNLPDLAYFPPGPQPVRLPISDLRRDGSFFDYDDDGAMLSYLTPPEYQDYALVDFVLDPEGVISDEEVFVSGSFNNWKPGRNWQMYYDIGEKAYKLRAWVPRARHNYLYATGKLEFESNNIYRYSYDEYEGNTTGGGQTYIMFFYYREFEFGGFDSIIAVISTSISDSYYFRR